MGFPARVIVIEDLDLPGSYNEVVNCDCHQVYGLKITADKGSIVIDFRNSSNGLYGGNCRDMTSTSIAAFIGRMCLVKSGGCY